MKTRGNAITSSIRGAAYASFYPRSQQNFVTPLLLEVPRRDIILHDIMVRFFITLDKVTLVGYIPHRTTRLPRHRLSPCP